MKKLLVNSYLFCAVSVATVYAPCSYLGAVSTEEKLRQKAVAEIEQAFRDNRLEGDVHRISCTFTPTEVCIKTHFKNYRKSYIRTTKPNGLQLNTPVTEFTYNRASNKHALLMVKKNNQGNRLQEKRVSIPTGSPLLI
jgi:hypothetical protein